MHQEHKDIQSHIFRFTLYQPKGLTVVVLHTTTEKQKVTNKTLEVFTKYRTFPPPCYSWQHLNIFSKLTSAGTFLGLQHSRLAWSLEEFSVSSWTYFCPSVVQLSGYLWMGPEFCCLFQDWLSHHCCHLKYKIHHPNAEKLCKSSQWYQQLLSCNSNHPYILISPFTWNWQLNCLRHIWMTGLQHLGQQSLGVLGWVVLHPDLVQGILCLLLLLWFPQDSPQLELKACVKHISIQIQGEQEYMW